MLDRVKFKRLWSLWVQYMTYKDGMVYQAVMSLPILMGMLFFILVSMLGSLALGLTVLIFSGLISFVHFVPLSIRHVITTDIEPFEKELDIQGVRYRLSGVLVKSTFYGDCRQHIRSYHLIQIPG